MEVPGECSVCHAHGPVQTCVLCGRLVCREHHDAASGACAVCLQRTGGSGSTRDPKAEPPNLPPNPDDAGKRYT